MLAEEVRLDSINCRDETCRISENLDPPLLESSLREIGQVNPVALLDRDSEGLMVVCGFRRLRAIRRLGQTWARARILSAGSVALPEAFRIALWDNLSHRQLNPLEVARALSTLAHTCGLPEDSLLKDFMPMLGLEAHPRVLRSYLGLHALHPQLRTQFSEGRLTLATVERLASRPSALQGAFASIMAGLRLTASLQRQTLELVDELAARNTCTAEEVLQQPEVVGISADAALAPNEKGQKLHDLLYRQRFPRISAAADCFAAARAELDLPGDVRVHHDRYFEIQTIRVEFEADSAARFRTLAGALDKAARSPQLEKLFQIS